ncbi:MAG: hypothetical protein NTW52_14465 [Planctomycetota bacterium]|nr:hypothetical protein [Planctomycetota bacterium]
MAKKLSTFMFVASLACMLWCVCSIRIAQAQFLDSVPGFSPAFRDVSRSIGPNGEGYTVFQDSNGELNAATYGPSRMQSYVDFSNVPIYYGPLVNRYMMPNQRLWQRNLVSSMRNDQELTLSESANPSAGKTNRKQDRIPMNAKNARKVANGVQPANNLAAKIVEPKPTPIPMVWDANGKAPTWLISAVDFIDRFVKAGDVSDALGACERLVATRSELPSDIYTRAAVLAFLEGRNLDEVGAYVALGTSDGMRLSSRNLPGGSLEKYLNPTERRRFTETVTRLRSQALNGAMSDEHKMVVEALLEL